MGLFICKGFILANASQPASQRAEVGKTNFGGATVDGNRQFMSGANWFQTQDATPTTNLVSPLTVTTGTVIPLIFPLNAISVTLLAATNTVNISEVSGTTSLSQFFALSAGQQLTIPVNRLSTIYLLGVTGSSVVSFMFNTI